MAVGRPPQLSTTLERAAVDVCNRHLLVIFHQIAENLFTVSISNHRPRGDRQTHILSSGTGFVRSASVLARVGPHVTPMVEV